MMVSSRTGSPMENGRALSRLCVSRGCLRRLAIGVLCLAALSAGRGAKAQVQLYRANLHSHTSYSDGAIWNVNDPSVNSPTTASAAARNAGLNCFATQDHGEYLAPSAFTATINQMAAATVAPNWSWGTTATGFVGLWGFEWTQAETRSVVGTSISGEGHIGVYGSLSSTGAMDRGSGITPATETQAIYWHEYKPPAPTTSQSLWQWILDHKSSPLGGTIVAQINHPCLYPGVSLANPTTLWDAEWWRKLEYVPALDPYVTLMEMGSHGVDFISHKVAYFGGSYNEPYFQLALDNGWHVAPTNNEDNHNDHFGSLRADDGTLTDTGIWAITLGAFTPQRAQSSVLSALRARRTFSAEDKADSHSNMISLKFMVQTPTGYRWMGSRDLAPADVQGGRCHLEITRGAGLSTILTGGSVQVITNRGVVALDLPTSGSGVKVNGTMASWDFSLPGDMPAAQIRASNTVLPANVMYNYSMKPLPEPFAAAPLDVAFDASPSGRVERYYYVRVKQSDGTLSYTAPIWIQHSGDLVDFNDAKYGGVPEKWGTYTTISANVVSFTWNFGDGSPAVEYSAATSTDAGKFDGHARHTYTANGTYYPRVTIRYKDGSTDVAVGRVYVGGTTPPTPFYGDVNGDSQVNDEDVAMLGRMAAGLSPASQTVLTRADIYPPAINDPVHPKAAGDLKVTILDSIRLARFLNGTGYIDSKTTWP